MGHSFVPIWLGAKALRCLIKCGRLYKTLYHNSVLSNLISISDSGFWAHLDGSGRGVLLKGACDSLTCERKAPEDLTALGLLGSDGVCGLLTDG
jgi:hypothetical protein